MRRIVWAKRILGTGALAGALMAQPKLTFGQSAESPANQKIDLTTVGALLQQLQAQVQDLHAQVQDLKVQHQIAKAESTELRKELDLAKSQLVALTTPANNVQPAQVLPEQASPVPPIEERISKLEENQQLADSKIVEQSQTKVESGSKYRLRLSGMLLFNMYGNRGNVDNTDFAQLAGPQGPLSTNGSTGASLRQSQIGIQAFGPTIAGAQTRADVQFDFSGGFPETPNGTSFGIMRLRTGTVRLDWKDTSVVAGQDALFFSPLSPTSIASTAVPALAYSGNLWSWTPQVRLEHKIAISESSSLLLQGGVLDSLSGETPFSQYSRRPTWGEASGQPAYATRVAWTQNLGGQNLTLGAGGYYGRQAWGFGRSADSWAGTIDVTVPLGKLFEFTSQFYRGRAVGGLNGGIGQSVIWQGSILDPGTQVYGLNSVGGWAQLKYRATSKLQFNGAFGQDNPYASDLRTLGGNTTYYPVPLSKNQSGFVNFIYQPRSDIVFSFEYRRLKTVMLDSNSHSADLVNISVGYIF
jgi:hypothetical protein